MKRGQRLTTILSGILGFFLIYRHFTHEEIQTREEFEEVPVEKWKLSPLWAEDQKPHINPHRHGILINNPNLCGANEQVLLLILVASAIPHKDRRNAIRETWASNLEQFSAKVVFLLGQGRDQQTKIHAENDIHHDIIQEDFEVFYRFPHVSGLS